LRKALLTLIVIVCFSSLSLCVIAEQELGVSIILPKNGSYVYPDVEVRWSLTGQANRTEIYVDGIQVDANIAPSKTSYYLFGLTNGTKQITVRVIGVRNESVEATVNVTVLTAPMNIVVVSPREGSVTNSSSVVISWNATGPIKLLTLSSTDMPDELTLDAGLRSYEVALKAEGEISVRLTAIDLRGPVVVRTLNIIHDSAPPINEIISPLDGQTTSQSVLSARWRSSDSASWVMRVEIYLDGDLISNATEGEKLLTDLADGGHVLQLVALDAAGNRDEVSARFTISVPFLSRYGLMIDLIIVACIGVALSYAGKAGLKRSRR
jgi:hypothetical protein